MVSKRGVAASHEAVGVSCLPSKKAQFTVFVVLGIVLVVAFGFAFYAKFLVVEAQLQTEAGKAVSQSLETTPITYYVTRCLEEATYSAITTISFQGGRIYDFQGGSTPFDPSKKGEEWLEFNVSEYGNRTVYVPYGVVQQDDDTCVDWPVPGYPYENVFASSWFQKYRTTSCFSDTPFLDQSGFFGKNILPKLCSKTGTNMPSSRLSTCPSTLYGKEKTVQDELQSMISRELASCTEFSIFEEMLGNNITVQNAPNVTVTFSNKGMFVDAAYPFIVIVRGKMPIVKLVSFQIESDIPLKEFYNIAHQIATRDSRYYWFSSEYQYLDIAKNPPFPTVSQLTLTRIHNSCQDCTLDTGFYDDVFVLKHNATLIEGKPLIFLFAVENRYPALDLVREPGLSGEFDFIAREGQRISLTPEGYDPDDGLLEYNYSGWKETEDATFDFGCCLQPGKDCAQRPQECTVRNLDDSPKNWTGSDDYKETGKDASYFLRAADAGLHFVRVSIFKEGRLFDFQDVKILVFDIPKANPKGRSPYTDISTNNASIEDFYALDASSSTTSALGGGTFRLFSWKDILEPFEIETPEYVQQIPEEENIGTIDDMTISRIESESEVFPFNELGVHQISLVATAETSYGTIDSEPGILEITVNECLPHRNNNVPAWPYSTGPFSALLADSSTSYGFDANHTCCYGGEGDSSSEWGPLWGQYRPVSSVCYNETIYGGKRELDNYNQNFGTNADSERFDFNDIKYPSSTSVRYYGPSNTIVPEDYYASGERKNDILMRTFARKCSGDRGNTCTGDAEEERRPYADGQCLDEGDGDRLCSGPPTVASATSVSCINYVAGDNFAKNYLGQNADGACNSEYVDSSVSLFSGYSLSGYHDGGVFSCKGYCDGSGGCNAVKAETCSCNAGNACDSLPATDMFAGKCSSGTWCQGNCEIIEYDLQKEACNCAYGTSNTGFPSGSRWLPAVGQTASGQTGGNCCEPGDTYKIAGFSGCIDGQYVQEDDHSQIACTWGRGNSKYWFGDQTRNRNAASFCCTNEETDVGANSEGCCIGTGGFINSNSINDNRKWVCTKLAGASFATLHECNAGYSGIPVIINGVKNICNGNEWMPANS